MTDESPEQPEELELLGTAEVASLLGIAKSSVADRRRVPIFPKPVAELSCGAIWTRAQIDEYLRQWSRGTHSSTYHWRKRAQTIREEWLSRPAPPARLSGKELYPWAQSPESEPGAI
jgi:predicted DNA-binding transcriptional regulator AlpA